MFHLDTIGCFIMKQQLNGFKENSRFMDCNEAIQ